MEPRKYLSDAVAAPPEAPAVPSGGYPTDGSDIGAQAATSPGAYWFYQIGEELRKVIVSAGLTPNYTALDQLNLAINAKIEAAASQIPIGSTLIMDGDVVPTGFLKRNGAELLRASYPEYWAYAQTVSNFVTQSTKDSDPEAYAGYYGDGDGSTTFTIPDWRGEFWRAWDDGRGVDVGRTIGSFQGDAIRNITGQVGTDRAQITDGTGAFDAPAQNAGANVNGTGLTIGRGFTFDASRVVPTADQNRPRSVSGMALVRAY